MTTTVCAWHRMYYPTEPSPILGRFDGKGTSHGICQRCRRRFELEEKSLKARTPAQRLGRRMIEKAIAIQR